MKENILTLGGKQLEYSNNYKYVSPIQNSKNIAEDH